MADVKKMATREGYGRGLVALGLSLYTHLTLPTICSV